MKFIASALSPFGFRLRLACRLKGLEIPFEPAPGGPGSAQHRALTPFARVPLLVLDGQEGHEGDPTVLVESLALLDYLEDAGLGHRALRPADPVQRARIRMLCLLFDHHVVKALGGVFAQLMKPAPDVALAAQAFDEVTAELARLVHFFDADHQSDNGAGPAVGGALSLADCAMVPFAFLMEALSAGFGLPSPIARVPRFANWWQAVLADADVAATVAQQREALAAMKAARAAAAAASSA
jgi:glutathione S-transferase